MMKKDLNQTIETRNRSSLESVMEMEKCCKVFVIGKPLIGCPHCSETLYAPKWRIEYKCQECHGVFADYETDRYPITESNWQNP
jgi:hypothetical protein